MLESKFQKLWDAMWLSKTLCMQLTLQLKRTNMKDKNFVISNPLEWKRIVSEEELSILFQLNCRSTKKFTKNMNSLISKDFYSTDSDLIKKL